MQDTEFILRDAAESPHNAACATRVPLHIVAKFGVTPGVARFAGCP